MCSCYMSGMGLPGRPGCGCDNLGSVLGAQGMQKLRLKRWIMGSSCNQLLGSQPKAWASSLSSWLGAQKHPPLLNLYTLRAWPLPGEAPPPVLTEPPGLKKNTRRPRLGATA